MQQTQLKIYEEDFKRERKVKESLLDERNNLNKDLQNQIEFNTKLQEEITRLKSQISPIRNISANQVSFHVI